MSGDKSFSRACQTGANVYTPQGMRLATNQYCAAELNRYQLEVLPKKMDSYECVRIIFQNMYGGVDRTGRSVERSHHLLYCKEQKKKGAPNKVVYMQTCLTGVWKRTPEFTGNVSDRVCSAELRSYADKIIPQLLTGEKCFLSSWGTEFAGQRVHALTCEGEPKA
ncbi:MAG: hypothetical protein HN337_09220 [Deltaproteobacteria bacterium]|nr:hypothetical protein [Deltaproteobacteria bacterium]